MRKLIGLAVAALALGGAGVALGGQAATNQNGEFVDLHAAAGPPVAGTAKVPRGVGLSFDSFTGNRINGDTPSQNTTITLRLAKGFRENSALFPACGVNPTALSTCSRAAQIGSGTAQAAVLAPGGAPPTFLPATLTIYNGRPFSSTAPTLIFIVKVSGEPTTEVDFTVKPEPGGPYGLAFDELVFQSPPPPGAAFQLTKFSFRIPDRTVTLKVHGKSVKVHLFEAPTTCNRAWQFAQISRYSNSRPLTATASQPCVNAPKGKR
jgi:hypothetical protein